MFSDLPVVRRETGVTTYSCNECDYTSENLYQYRLHLANHGSFPHLVKDVPEDLPFKCGYCVYVAEDEGDFGAHIASHLERRNFRCSKCEYTAFKRSAVQFHIQSTHDETEEIEVIDLQAENVSDKGGSVEEPQLVNLDPKVKVVPVNDLDLDREGLTLFSPPSSPEALEQREGREFQVDSEDVGIIGLGTPSMVDLELDNQSDSTEEWGTNPEDQSREGSPALSDQTPAPTSGSGSILRLTLQGKLTGEYGIKRAVPADMDAALTDASASRDSMASIPSDDEDNQAQDDAEVESVQGFEPMDEVDGVSGVDDGGGEQVEDEESPLGLVNEDEENEALTGRTSKDEVQEGDIGNVFTTLNSWLDK